MKANRGPCSSYVKGPSKSSLDAATLSPSSRNFAGVDVLRGLPWAISALKHPAAGAPSLHGPGSVPEDCAAQPLESNVPEDAFPVPARPNISGAHPQESIKPRPLVSRSPVDWQADLPPFPKITADDERMASVEGHFLARLKEAEMVDDSGKPTELGRSEVSQLRATYIHLMINKMLSMNRRYQTVLAVVRDVGCYMSPVNLATAMHRLGRLARAARATRPNLPQQLCQHPQYRFMLQRAEESISSMSPRAVANFLWGMAAMGDNKNTGIVLRLGQRLMELDPRDLKTQELSNVVWGLATLEVHMPQLLDRMLDSACKRMDECVPQALSNMIWACATLRHEHPRFVYAVAASASPRLHTFQSQTLANTLWAYSVLGVYPPELFQNAAEEMVRRMNDTERKSRGEGDNGSGSEGGWSENEGKPAWENGAASGGYTGHTSQNRFNTKRAAMCEFRGQEISNVLIAYARGCIIHPGLLHAVERELCRTPSQDSSEPGNADEVLYVERLTDFTSQALANTLWAFATLRWYPARLLPRITEAMPSIVPSMTSQELANSLWAYARFAYHPGRVMATFLAVIERRTDEFEGQGCTNSLWALAVLKATHSAAFVGLLQRYVQLERTSNMFGELQYNQVLQAVLLAQFEARGGRVAWRPEVDLPEDLVDRALNAWASQQTSTQLSGFHLDVSEGLVRLGIAHGIEYLVARNLLSIDIAVTTEGRQIAIEVDGPFHFPVNARTPLGHTMIRRRLLRAAGWTVVSIPWYEWFAMQTWEDRLQYLAEILSRADETLVQQLRPAVRDLLSTDFAPGPGVDADDEEADLESAVPGTLEAGGSPRSSMRSILEPPRLAPDRGLDIGEDGPVLSYSTNDPENDVETGLMEVLGRSNIQLTSGAIRRLQSMGLEDVVRQIGERKKAGGRNSKSGSFAAGTTSSLYGSAGSRPDMYCPPPSMRRGEDNEPGVLLPKPSRLRGPNVRRSSKARFNPHFLNSPSTWGFYPHEHQDSEMKPSGGSASSRRREWPTNEAARSTMDQAQPEHVGDNDTSPHAGEQGAGGEGGSGVDVVVVNAEGGLEAVPPPEGHGGGDSISEDK